MKSPVNFTLILYGDVPLINHELLLRLIDVSKKTGIGLVTFDKTNPTGFGRIVRDDKKKKIIKIVEEKDCDQEQKQINEINTGNNVCSVGSFKAMVSTTG